MADQKKRSTASYKAAAKKAAATRKRNARGTSVSRTTKTVTKRRKYTPRKKGMLSQMFTPAGARGGAMAAASGFGGGTITSIIDKLLNQLPVEVHSGWRIAGYLGGGFVLATLFKAPNMGAGMSAIAAYKMLEVVGLSQKGDNAKFANDIERMPKMLDKHGQPMAAHNNYLQQMDNNYSLQQNDAGTAYLAAQGYQVSYAPDFGAPTSGFQGY